MLHACFEVRQYLWSFFREGNVLLGLDKFKRIMKETSSFSLNWAVCSRHGHFKNSFNSFSRSYILSNNMNGLLKRSIMFYRKELHTDLVCFSFYRAGCKTPSLWGFLTTWIALGPVGHGSGVCKTSWSTQIMSTWNLLASQLIDFFQIVLAKYESHTSGLKTSNYGKRLILDISWFMYFFFFRDKQGWGSGVVLYCSLLRMAILIILVALLSFMLNPRFKKSPTSIRAGYTFMIYL